MTPQEMTEVRNQRFRAAFNVETPDRIPIFLQGQGYFKFIDPTATLADYFRRPQYVDDLQIEAAKLPILREIDFSPACGFVNDSGMQLFASMFFAKMRLPGRELSENTLWYVDEQGPMTEADYDTILDKGWEPLKLELFKRIDYDPAAVIPPDKTYMKQLSVKIGELGRSSIYPLGLYPFPPFETLSAARSLKNFVRDLRRIPDKVRAALDIIEDSEVNATLEMCKPGSYGHPREAAFIAGTRAGSTFISAATFEKFYFTYYRKLIPAMHSANVKTWLHMDNDWSGFLHYFREFPKGQCIWDPDQMTDILKIKEILGDKMCITGNLSPALLSIGTPEECYTRAANMCSNMGKTGFIMASGCSVPIDAKRENIEAVISATLDA